MMARLRDFKPALVTLVLLGAFEVQTLSRPQPDDAEPFHAHIRQVCEKIPKVIGDWVGTDLPNKPGAVALLRPNFMLHRRYANAATGQIAEFLIVQCRDARDMAGHYPPVCYPAHGWTVAWSKAVRWEVSGRSIPGMEYEYTRIEEGRSIRRVVSNLLILPDGQYVHGMDEIHNAATDYRRQYFGAAQIQVVVDADIPEQQRRDIVVTLLGANLPVLDSLSSKGTL